MQVDQEHFGRNEPQRRGPSGANLTVKEQAARVMLVQDMQRRHGKVWQSSRSYDEQSLTFPKEMSQAARGEFRLRLEAAVATRMLDLKAVQADFKTDAS
jgi:hypothetical protein